MILSTTSVANTTDSTPDGSKKNENTELYNDDDMYF